MGSASGDKNASNAKKLEDQRKSKEEINRLKLQREQQNALLLEQQRKDAEKLQISLSSQAEFDSNNKAPKQPSTIQMNFTGTTNPGEDGYDSPSLTESRFRRI